MYIVEGHYVPCSGKLSREKLSWIGEKTFCGLVTFAMPKDAMPPNYAEKLSWIATKLWKSFLPQKIPTIRYTVPSRSHQREWWGLSPHSFESPTQTVLPNPWEGKSSKTMKMLLWQQDMGIPHWERFCGQTTSMETDLVLPIHPHIIKCIFAVNVCEQLQNILRRKIVEDDKFMPKHTVWVYRVLRVCGHSNCY